METASKSRNSKRKLPLQDIIVTLLNDFRNAKKYVFGGDKPLDPKTMQNHYKKILKEAGIAYKNFHTLRHTYATNCIEGGTDVKSLSEMLGHSSVNHWRWSNRGELPLLILNFFNEPLGIRTPDNLIKSQVLYRLS